MIPCRICEGPVLSQLDFGLQPICNRFLVSARDTEYKHILKLGVCQQCRILQLIDHFPKEKLQPTVNWVTYNEPEGHLDKFAEQFNVMLPPRAQIFGISFKDDSTLSRLEKKGFKVKRLELLDDLGITFPGAGAETIQLKLTQDLARKISQKYGKADALVVRHILEHVYDIPNFLAALKELLNPTGVLVLEVPDCSRQLDLLDYSTIWEEHLLYFTPLTFQSCLLKHGFIIDKFEVVSSAIEGPMVAVVRLNKDSSAENNFSFSVNVAEEVKRVQTFCRSFSDFKKKMRDFFCQQPVAIFGAGHSAAILINLLELPVSRVIDDNPNKKGLYMPGSRVLICGSDTLQPEELCVLGVNPSAESKIVARFPLVNFRSFNPLSIYSLYSSIQPLKNVSTEVYYAAGSMVSLDKRAIDDLKRRGLNNERQRIRICTHKTVSDRVHEMIIVHTQGTYVRPHKHLNKSESFHVVEGNAWLILFDDVGAVLQTIELGDYASGKQFYYRLDESYYHTLLITSPLIVFHEATKGPFNREETVFPSWAPDDNHKEEIEIFMTKLKRENISFTKP